MGNKRYDKLQASFEASQPQLPTDFTHRVMKRVQSKSHRAIRMRRVMIAALAVAASFVFVVLFVKPNQSEPEKALAVSTKVPRGPRPTYLDTADPRTSTPSTHEPRPVRTSQTQSSHLTDSEHAPDVLISAPHEDSSKMEPATLNEPHLHYATHIQIRDTVPYQDPARVDEFIAKLADNYNVKQGELQCSLTQDSCVVSAVYVFPDQKEIDVFGRLLQVACWYSDETPGYHLNFSHRQFFFELKDMRKQLQYRWIAERVNGKILLYSTCAPIDVVVSSACYQEYLDELMHTKSINSKTLDI
ncbi:MAG: hypothetical protein J6T44_10925 [Prevotella sp.]|nr:hypothetical protein [Prevotella sp.]